MMVARQLRAGGRNGMEHRMRAGPAEGASVSHSRIRAVAATGIAKMILEYGGNPERVFWDAGLKARDLELPLNQLALRDYCALLEAAARQTNVEAFGLLFAGRAGCRLMGDLGALALNHPILGAAISAICQYFVAIQERSRLSLSRNQDQVILEYRICDRRIVDSRQDAELTIGSLLSFLRRCLGSNWSPDEIRFGHPARDATSAPYDLLGAPVLFDQPENAVIFNISTLSRPVPGSDPAKIPLLARHLARLSHDSFQTEFVDRVQEEVRRTLPEGNARFEEVAARLGMTPITLYRRLRDQGVEFSDLIRGCRYESALGFLRDPELPLTEVALLLGYSELSSFSRAFRQWMGVSPTRFRRSFSTPNSAAPAHTAIQSR
jgi:AraC-like DNA-binding protein